MKAIGTGKPRAVAQELPASTGLISTTPVLSGTATLGATILDAGHIWKLFIS